MYYFEEDMIYIIIYGQKFSCKIHDHVFEQFSFCDFFVKF